MRGAVRATDDRFLVTLVLGTNVGACALASAARAWRFFFTSSGVAGSATFTRGILGERSLFAPNSVFFSCAFSCSSFARVERYGDQFLEVLIEA